MPELTWIAVVTVLALLFVAGFAWTSGCALATALWARVLRKNG